MKSFIKIFLAAGMTVAAIFTGCKNDSESENGIFYAQLRSFQEDAVYPLLVETDVTIPIGRFAYEEMVYAESGAEAVVEADMSLVEAYNSVNGTSYLPLPSGVYSLDKNTLTIDKGKKQSDLLYVTISPGRQLQTGAGYLMPVTIRSANGDVVFLNEAKKTIYVVFDATEYAKVYMVGADSEDPIFVANNRELVGMPILSVAYEGTVNYPSPVDVSFQADISLVTAYNIAHNTYYDPLPVNSWTFDFQSVTIRKGKNISEKVNVIVNPRVLKEGRGYLLPVTITTVTTNDPKFVPDEQRKTVYLLFYLEPNKAKSKWKVIDVSDYEESGNYGIPTNLFDNDPETLWHTHISAPIGVVQMPHFVAIDMVDSVRVYGLKFYNNPAYFVNGATDISAPRSVVFELSKDNTTWVEAHRVSSLPFVQIQFVEFPVAMIARYFRITVLDSYSQPYTSIAEIDVLSERSLDLRFVEPTRTNMTEHAEGYWEISPGGNDPYVFTTTLTADLREKNTVSFSFEYQSNTSITDGQIFYGVPNVSAAASSPADIQFQNTGINAANESLWKSFNFDLSDAVATHGWGDVGHRLRFDYTNSSSARMLIRNVKITYQDPDPAGDL
ncbi:MAG: DUF1735 domain-containing protein [Bacteroidales bacterium]|jgi:hypothetical protein|nr:DUF1735 domain-containing protein [Bacteroidales bacterium]